MKRLKLNTYLLPFFIYLFIAHIIFFALPFAPSVKKNVQTRPRLQPLMVIEEKLIPSKQIVTKEKVTREKTSTTTTISKKTQQKPKKQAPIYKQEKPPPLSIPLPTPIENLHSKNMTHMPKLTLQSFKNGYENKLIFLMQQGLKLPKYGEVKVAITLHCSGKVIDIKILDAQNDENKNYLLESILKLDFPPFGGESQENVQTFTVNFFNS